MQEHEKWLDISNEDLKKAKYLIKGEFYRGSMYDCQQAAEKALKGYLTYKEHEILKSHDLIKLLDLCVSYDIKFDKIKDSAKYLNPLSTKFRYPTEFDIPDKEETKLAIKHAGNIVRFVNKKIAEQCTGQINIFEK